MTLDRQQRQPAARRRRARSAFRTSRAACSRRWIGRDDRPYSDEFNVGIEYQLVPTSRSASYHRRQHRNGLGIVDRARPASAYTPEERTFTDPEGRPRPSPSTVSTRVRHAPRPRHHQRRRARERLRRRAVRLPEADVEPLAAAGWSDGAEAPRVRSQRHVHEPGPARTDFNNPNYLFNRDDGSVFIELPWTFTLSGSYLLPW